MGQAALAERHPEVSPKTTVETSEELDWGGIGAELGNQSPLLIDEIENDVRCPQVQSLLPGFDSEVYLHTQVGEKQPGSRERPTIPTQ